MTDAALRVLSLGAGVQSTTILLLACENPALRFDAAIFADTGWEPRPVYDHLARLEGAAKAAGIPTDTVCRPPTWTARSGPTLQPSLPGRDGSRPRRDER